MKGRVLIVAGSDSSGGAGIQADIKTVTALGAYAATAITALTAQDTERFHAIMPVEPGFVRQQMSAVLRDIGADCIKTGMLLDAGIVDAVADCLDADAPGVPLVVDPVMIASSGARLLAEAGVLALKRRLIPRATVLTPNLPEAEALAGCAIASLADMRLAAARLLELGARSVVLTGGHLPGEVLYDVALDARQSFVLEARRIATRATHGTGCTFASAIAASLAQGLAFRPAVERAHAYVQEAIRTAPGFGRGHGPLNHAHPIIPQS
jgi:hydroxymethylpyrimidine/phosphomethylpyrimidine kinase